MKTAEQIATLKCEYIKKLANFEFASEKEREYFLSIPKDIMYLNNKQQVVVEFISKKKNIFIYKEIFPYITIKNNFDYVEKSFKHHTQLDIFKNKKKIAIVRKFRRVIHCIILDDEICFQDIFEIKK